MKYSMIAVFSACLAVGQTCPDSSTSFQAAHANNYTTGRSSKTPRWIVIHAQSGTNAGTIQKFQNGCQLTNCASGGDSAHYVVGRAGQIIQMVKHSDTAHHAGNFNYNLYSIGIELEDGAAAAYLNNPNWATDELYAAAGRLVACLASEFNIPLSHPTANFAPTDPSQGSGIIGHFQIPGSGSGDPTLATGKRDPGKYFDWNKLMSNTSGFTLTASPSVSTIKQGGNAAFALKVSAINFSSVIALGVSGLPPNVVWPTGINNGNNYNTLAAVAPQPNATARLSIFTSASTPAGSYQITITGTSGNIVKKTQVGLIVDFAQETISAPRLSGPTSGTLNSALGFTASGASSSLGSPLVYDWDWGDGTQTTGAGASAAHGWTRIGGFSVRVRARSTKNSSIVSAYSNSVPIQITAPTLAVSCYFNPATVTLGKATTMVGSVSGGVTPYQYLWPGKSSYSSTSTSTVNPTSTGRISYSLTVKDNSGQTKNANCSVQVNGPPPAISGYRWTSAPRNRINFSGTISGSGFVSGAQVFFCVSGSSTCYQQPPSLVGFVNSTTLNVVNANLTVGNWQLYVKTQYGTSARSSVFYVAR